MPYFAAAGYDSYAVSIRGQGGSDRTGADGKQLAVSGDLQSLTDDLAHVVAALPSPPILVAHSFGALLAEKYATELGGGGSGSARPPLAGIAVVCGVPPSGNKTIILRVCKTSLVLAWRITWWVDEVPGAALLRGRRVMTRCQHTPLPHLQGVCGQVVCA